MGFVRKKKKAQQESDDEDQVSTKKSQRSKGRDEPSQDEVNRFLERFARENAPAEDSDDESSAGAFHDVGGGSDDEPVRGVIENLEGEDDDTPQKHAEELKDLQTKDPEFYKFLVEQDPSLLNFSVPDDDAEHAAEEGEEEVEKPDDVGGAGEGKLLTHERWDSIKEATSKSWTACRAALKIYNIAVRSLQHHEDACVDEGGTSTFSTESTKKQTFRIEDETVFSDAIEWSVANLLERCRQHAGDLKWDDRPKRRRKNKAGEKKDKDNLPPKPEQYEKANRVRMVNRLFWVETNFLLQNLEDATMLQFILKHISSPAALAWLWEWKPIRNKCIKRCCFLWSSSGSHNVRLLSFIFIRNSATMIIHRPDVEKQNSKRRFPQLQMLLRMVLKYFADATTWGYTWKSISTFRFMENCIVELLRLHGATAYRLGYVCIRQLALLLRNSTLAVSRQGKQLTPKAKEMQTDKSKARRSRRTKDAEALVGWPFVRAISLWSRAVCELKHLRLLTFPLATVATGAVKAKLPNLNLFPFVYHLVVSLNRVGASAEMFVPVSSFLLDVLAHLSNTIENVYNKAGKDGKKKQTLDSSVKAPELDIMLRLNETHMKSALALETVGSNICFLFTDHLGLLSQSPAYPEITTPVVMHIRRIAKKCRSDPLRRQLKKMVERVEASIPQVKEKREAFTKMPDGSKFLLLAPDSVIAQARVEALERKVNEERNRVQAEREARNAPTDGDRENVEETKKVKKRMKVVEEEKEGDEDGKKTKKAKKGANAERMAERARKASKNVGALTNKDKLEVMDFGDDED